MTNQFKKYAILAMVLAIGAVCSADVLLDDTFADADRTETDLPNESAVWAGTPTSITMGTGSLAYAQSSSSQKLWTYFAANGSPVSLSVGDKLVATIEFSPEGAFYDSTSRNFRFGLFTDPTDAQIHADVNDDGGGTGDLGQDDPWTDSTGYAVQFSLSSTTASTIQVGKRTDQANNSLLGSGGAYTWSAGGGRASNLTLDTVYTMTMTLDYQAAEQMLVSFTFAEGETVIGSETLSDTSLGGDPVWTDFDHLFFRFSSTTGTADVIDFHRIKIEYITGEAPYEGPVIGKLHPFPAIQSCRTNGGTPDNNDEDYDKLSVRRSSPGAKSWIKFDIGDLDVTNLRAATLKVTFYEAEGGSHTFDVSAVNDDCLDNINWTDQDLTWTNAPGNLTSDLALLDSAKTELIKTVSTTDVAVGYTVAVDVLSIVEADTDGIVQFVLHNSDVLMQFTTHDSGKVPSSYYPVLEVIETPEGADWPIPYPGQRVTTDLDELSWTNPEPNLPGGEITCTVYFGTDPNRPEMDWVTLDVGVETVALTAGNFPNFAPVEDKQTYYWYVDCHDTTRDEVLEGLEWYFDVNNNEAPEVDAGPEQVTWGLPKVINLNGTTSDDGLPVPPGAYTVEWTQDSGPTVVIDPDDQDDTSVTITEAGVYVFRLKADDGEAQPSDTVRIVVGEDSCDASHLSTGDPYDPGDFNEDCLVNLEDFAALIAADWLNCTDEQTFCE